MTPSEKYKELKQELDKYQVPDVCTGELDNMIYTINEGSDNLLDVDTVVMCYQLIEFLNKGPNIEKFKL